MPALLFWLLLSLGCGARTGLSTDSDLELAGGGAGQAGAAQAGAAQAGAAQAGAAQAGAAQGGAAQAGAAQGGAAQAGAAQGGAAQAGAGGAPSPPVRTNCQLLGDDPRVAGIKPDEIASLRGSDFVVGDVQSYHWTLQMEDCDAVVQDAQFRLQDADSPVVHFQPSRPGIYHFTLEVTGVGGDRTSCKLAVPVKGIGMRVELCWDTSTTTDLDLYLHTPFDREPWFARGSASIQQGLNNTTCNTSNATADLRSPPRVNWGYADSPLSACNTPSFDGFLGIGRCPNPRAANDNNQSIATGTTERMQLDNPGNGQRFRVMIQNFNNLPARPHVFVYCGGQQAGSFNAPPSPANFQINGGGTYGLMWRATDITTSIDAAGKVSCSTAPVTDRTAVTNDDPTF